MTLIEVNLTVFVCIVYAVEREVPGLRRIAGYGVAVTRGAANAMMYTYACLLVTMCRNLITKLRDTVLHRYIPFDEAVSMHKYVAFWAGFFTRQYQHTNQQTIGVMLRSCMPRWPCGCVLNSWSGTPEFESYRCIWATVQYLLAGNLHTNILAQNYSKCYSFKMFSFKTLICRLVLSLHWLKIQERTTSHLNRQIFPLTISLPHYTMVCMTLRYLNIRRLLKHYVIVVIITRSRRFQLQKP